MSSYRVEFTTAAAKEIRKLDPGIRRRILSDIAELEQEPRPAGYKKLAAESNAWRIRMGNYRVLYDVVDDVYGEDGGVVWEDDGVETFMQSLASDILNTFGPGRRFVAVDGVDGSGKTSFAANLVVEIRDRPVIVIHADDFLNPSPVRHAKGRTSPEGFWKDTYDYSALQNQLLVPLGPGGDGWYSPASFDPEADRMVQADVVRAPSDALIVVEGMFLHRDELVSYWDASVRRRTASLLRRCTTLGTCHLCRGQLRLHVAESHPSRNGFNAPVRVPFRPPANSSIGSARPTTSPGAHHLRRSSFQP